VLAREQRRDEHASALVLGGRAAAVHVGVPGTRVKRGWLSRCCAVGMRRRWRRKGRQGRAQGGQGNRAAAAPGGRAAHLASMNCCSTSSPFSPEARLALMMVAKMALSSSRALRRRGGGALLTGPRCWGEQCWDKQCWNKQCWGEQCWGQRRWGRGVSLGLSMAAWQLAIDGAGALPARQLTCRASCAPQWAGRGT
jgi:hypothetical protein